MEIADELPKRENVVDRVFGDGLRLAIGLAVGVFVGAMTVIFGNEDFIVATASRHEVANVPAYVLVAIFLFAGGLRLRRSSWSSCAGVGDAYGMLVAGLCLSWMSFLPDFGRWGDQLAFSNQPGALLLSGVPAVVALWAAWRHNRADLLFYVPGLSLTLVTIGAPLCAAEFSDLGRFWSRTALTALFLLAAATFRDGLSRKNDVGLYVGTTLFTLGTFAAFYSQAWLRSVLPFWSLFVVPVVVLGGVLQWEKRRLKR